MSFTPRPTARTLLACAVALVALPATMAQAAPSRADIDAAFLSDRAACLDSASMQDRTACLREAGAVRAEALRGVRHASPDADELARNALQRCSRLPVEHQAFCERRMMGEGTVTGSVAAGGLLRELVIEVPAEADAPTAG